jgi:hypothetical protein
MGMHFSNTVERHEQVKRGRVVGELCTVYVYLLDEGVDVWRPVTAERLSPELFRLSGPVPERESWQFQPGEVVRCEERRLSGGLTLVAVQRNRA